MRERFHNFSERVEVVFLAGLPMTGPFGAARRAS